MMSTSNGESLLDKFNKWPAKPYDENDRSLKDILGATFAIAAGLGGAAALCGAGLPVLGAFAVAASVGLPVGYKAGHAIWYGVHQMDGTTRDEQGRALNGDGKPFPPDMQ